ncbi:hypothetical protein [Desulfobaculum xiamenense]|uniref:hypothetical protein n=1 Tax=Desulfobaculum xiamenense TaxID=995050 RepID=UPI00143A052A|nr:hypothetical protein [Desulfobaculum xiamenense]
MGIEVHSESVPKAAKDLKGLEQQGRKTETATESMQRSFERAERAIGQLRNAVTALVGAYGLQKVTTAFVDAAREAEGYRVRLNALLQSQAEGNRLFQEMAAFAAQVPFEYSAVMASATQLAGVLSGGVEEIKRWMPMIADLAAVSGLSIEEATGQVVRMYSAGAGAADMFRERGILAMMGFEQGVSYSVEETRRKMFEAWESSTSKFRGVTDEYAQTWDGTVSMLADKWFQFRTAVMDAGPFQAMKSGLQEFLVYLDSAQGRMALDEWAYSTASGVVTAFKTVSLAAVGLINGFQTVELAFRSVDYSVKELRVSFIEFAQWIDDFFPESMRQSEEWAQRDLLNAKLRASQAKAALVETAIAISDTGEAYDKLQESLDRMMEAARAAREESARLNKTLSGAGEEGAAATQQLSQKTEKLEKQIKETTKATAVFGETISDAMGNAADDTLEVIPATERLAKAEEEAAARVTRAWKAVGDAKSSGGGSAAGSGTGASSFSSGDSVGRVITVVAPPGPEYYRRLQERVRIEERQRFQVEEAARQAQAAQQARQAAQQEALRAAQEELRGWQAVHATYSNLLAQIEPFESTLSLSQLQSGFSAAAETAEAASDFFADLQWHVTRLSRLKSGFEALSYNIGSEITRRERADWSAGDYWTEYSRLYDEFESLNKSSETYYDRALSLSESMYQVLMEIESSEQRQVAEIESMNGSLLGIMGATDSTRAALMGSDLNPAQSLEWYSKRYSTLFNRASGTLESADVQEFLSFAQQSYLPFLKSYGGAYQGVFESVLDDISTLQDAAGFEIASTYGSLTALSDAMGDVGLYAEWLAKQLASGGGLSGALGTASGGVHGLSRTLDESVIPFGNVTTALKSLASSTESNLGNVANMMSSLVSSIREAVAALQNQANQPVTVVVEAPKPQPRTEYDTDWKFVPTHQTSGRYHDTLGGAGFIDYIQYFGYWTTPHGGKVSDHYYNHFFDRQAPVKPTRGYAYTTYAAAGGFATEPTLAGEAGPEWVIPVDKPKNRDFLRDIGLTSERLADAFRKALGPMLHERAGGGGAMRIELHVDGREIANVVADQFGHNDRLVLAARRAL